jgi:hypothetical protein
VRVVEFRGAVVRRQRKISVAEAEKLADRRDVSAEQLVGKILILFHGRAPMIVTPQEWRTYRRFRYYPNTVRRQDVCREKQYA